MNAAELRSCSNNTPPDPTLKNLPSQLQTYTELTVTLSSAQNKSNANLTLCYYSLLSDNAKYAPIQCQMCSHPMPNVLHNWHCVHNWHWMPSKNGIVCTNGIVCIIGIVYVAQMSLFAHLALSECTNGIVCIIGIVWNRKCHCVHNWHCVNSIYGIVCTIGIV